MAAICLGLNMLTPHRDAFLHHLWGEIVHYSVWEEPRQTKGSD